MRSIVFFLLFIPQIILSSNGFSHLFLDCKHEISGTVKNMRTNELIPNAKVQLLQNGVVLETQTTGEDGLFKFYLECGMRYNFYVVAENFTVNSKILYTTSKSETKSIDLFLYPAKEFFYRDANKYLDINPIDFETDVDFLPDVARIELEKVINLMKKYPEIRVSIDVHTDSKGDEAYSLEITEIRAEIIYNYLISNGIHSDRLERNGYGFSKILNHCHKNIKCLESEHKENRRIEFIVIP